uniref:Uncharacterized protein n=1 Tax=Triticum urartu TaxID=4572 RepID=A0A8R7UWY3_TRIUA
MAAAPRSWSARLIVPCGFEVTTFGRRSPANNIIHVLTDARGSTWRSRPPASRMTSRPTSAAPASPSSSPSTTPSPASLPVLRFHVLHSYYRLGSLESIKNPVQPTSSPKCTVAGCFVPPVLGGANINVGVDVDGAIESCDVDPEAAGLCNCDAGRCKGEDIIAGVRVRDAEERTP